ncbi:glycoside hydrolase family 88/105 protein [Bacillus solitudinis]|uniref:glycoside hydrolase family 88/105 protein n=1 Tax=Bacillus solitudinis TaxID=2014074 RepID=UPI000C248AAA|nr:glycoside hydrolase family 88 protein [Bacillus solitudinis]
MKEEVRKALYKIINQLLNLKRPNDETALKELGEDGKSFGYFPRDFGMEEWDWPQGIGLYGLKKLSGEHEFPDYNEFIKNWANEQINRELPLKNINTTAPLLTLMDYEDMEQLSLEWMEWIYNECPRTKEKGLQHVTSGESKSELSYHDQEIWIDTLFMVVLFTAKMGIKYNKEDWKNEAAYQFTLHMDYLFNEDDLLLYHGYDFKNENNFSEAYWCRGNSWFTLAVPEYIEILKNEVSSDSYRAIVNMYKLQVNKLVELQSQNGLWHTLLDDDESYTEVSGSAAITAGILKGIRLGLLDSSYIQPCRKAIAAILRNISEDGTVLNVSAGTAIGKEKEDYKKIVIAPTAYGQALVMVLLAEVLNLEGL